MDYLNSVSGIQKFLPEKLLSLQAITPPIDRNRLTLGEIRDMLALIIALAAVVTLSYKAWKGVGTAFQNFFKVWRDSVMQTLHVLVDDMAIVKKEVTLNGGGSLKDTVMDFIGDLALETAARRSSETRALWEGRITKGIVVCVSVSKEWTRITGLSFAESSSENWARFVSEGDRTRVLSAAVDANTRQTFFVAHYLGINVVNGKRYTVTHRGEPVNARGNTLAWVGWLETTEIV